MVDEDEEDVLLSVLVADCVADEVSSVLLLVFVALVGFVVAL